MSDDDQKRHEKALVQQSNRGLITRSTGLVRRGLGDLLKRYEADPLEELRRLAKELAEGRFTEFNSIGMEFINIPAGSFMMGSDLKDDEKPIHNVTIQEDFFMGRYPVTQSQWQQVMGSNPSEFVGGDYPVHGVSWDDAQEFIRKLNVSAASLDGDLGTLKVHYRLPTEAEWEYSCRAGTTGDYAGPLDSIAWYVRPLAGSCPPRAVGTKEANAFGLYDMHGNVWEWCQDFYYDNYYGSSPNTDPQGPRSGQYRVLRGGSWNCAFATALRSANRYGSTPAARVNDIGFRVVAVVRTQ